MGMSRLPPKDPAEKKVLRFPFASEIDDGDSIASAAVEVLAIGAGDDTPNAMRDGAAVVDAANHLVLQRVQGGVAGVEYNLRCLATTTAGQVHLISGVLPVRSL